MDIEVKPEDVKPVVCLPFPHGILETGLVEPIEGGYLLKEGVVVVFTETFTEEHTKSLLAEAAKVTYDRLNQDPVHPISES